MCKINTLIKDAKLWLVDDREHLVYFVITCC
jgi:hypothetical protein